MTLAKAAMDQQFAVFSLNFSLAGKGPFLTGKAKICTRGALSRQGSGFAFMKAFIFEHPVELTEKYFKHLKTKNFTNEGCLCL